jgi:hypothetical protein
MTFWLSAGNNGKCGWKRKGMYLEDKHLHTVSGLQGVCTDVGQNGDFVVLSQALINLGPERQHYLKTS